MEYKGIIKRIRFYSDETKYIVCVFEADDGDTFIATGNMSYVNEDDRYLIKGEYVIHPKYGQQFKIESYEILLANDEDEIIRYLSSALFKGIGKKQATLIVEALGNDALNMIKDNPDCLDHIKGMSQTKKDTILTVLNTQSYDQEVLNFFMGHGISTRFIAMIQAIYGDKTLEIIQDNPYELIDTIDGLGFKTADDIASKLGFDPNHPYRIKAAIVYALKENCYRDGCTYTSKDAINTNFNRYIYGLNELEFNDYLDSLIDERRIIVEEERYYSTDLYESEETISRVLKRYIQLPVYENDEKEINDSITRLEKMRNIQYDDYQKDAMKTFLTQSVMILTGGPGTGKTTIVDGIIRLYRELNPDQSIALCAPTGRAAKRLSEVTGLEAYTIHRLLKWDLHTNTFAVNADNPLDYDVLIIDEFSMVDSLLFSALLESSRRVGKILIIGDDQQLPSVSPGNVLNDLIESKLFTTIQLNHIYRQSGDSGIIQLAHHIRNNEYDQQLFFDYNNIYFESCINTDIVSHIETLVLKAINSGYDQSDIQVLAPMYQGVAGIDAINHCLQNVFNPKENYKNELQVGKRLFREGDKVLQLKNRVDDNVFNGDIGTLVEINYKDNFEFLTDTLVIDFDGIFVEYTGQDLFQITHAYCMSVHKSQGNEFKIVIMPVLYDYYIMLKKNLLYTGITRAKQSLFLLGNHTALLQGIENDQDINRVSTLKERLKDDHSLNIYDFLDEEE